MTRTEIACSMRTSVGWKKNKSRRRPYTLLNIGIKRKRFSFCHFFFFPVLNFFLSDVKIRNPYNNIGTRVLLQWRGFSTQCLYAYTHVCVQRTTWCNVATERFSCALVRLATATAVTNLEKKIGGRKIVFCEKIKIEWRCLKVTPSGIDSESRTGSEVYRKKTNFFVYTICYNILLYALRSHNIHLGDY